MVTKRRHVKAVIQLRRAIEADWIRVDPILREGESALSTDIYRLKIGNGHDHWSDIPYLLENEMTFIEELIENRMYTAGNGIVIVDREISLDDLILDCGTSTTNVGG